MDICIAKCYVLDLFLYFAVQSSLERGFEDCDIADSRPRRCPLLPFREDALLLAFLSHLINRGTRAATAHRIHYVECEAVI